MFELFWTLLEALCEIDLFLIHPSFLRHCKLWSDYVGLLMLCIEICFLTSEQCIDVVFLRSLSAKGWHKLLLIPGKYLRESMIL